MKTILSSILFLMLLLTYSQGVFAQVEPYLNVSGVDVLKANHTDVLGDGGSVSYDAASKTLTLRNANISSIGAKLTLHTIKVIGKNMLSGDITIGDRAGTEIVITGNSVAQDRLCFYSTSGSINAWHDWDDETLILPDLTIRHCYISMMNRGSISGDAKLKVKDAYIEINRYWGGISGFTNLIVDNGISLSEPEGGIYNETLRRVTVDGVAYNGRIVLDARSVKGDVLNTNVIALHQVDGYVATYAFEDKPVISYTETDLVLTTSSITVQYPLHTLRKLTIEGDWKTYTAIDDAVVPDTEFSFSEEGTKVRGEKPGTPFYVFDAQGTKCTEGVIDAEGKANIQLSNLPKGIYVVKTQSTSFKVKK